MFKSFFVGILNIIFPAYCLSCGTLHTPLCKECVAKLPAVVCAHPHTTALFAYRNSATRQAIWMLKYHGNKDITHVLATALYDKILEDTSEEMLFTNTGRSLLIPIPLSSTRLRRRGFNQSILLAQQLENIDKNTTFTCNTDVLYKIKDTPSQTKLKDKTARLQNLAGCFSVKDRSAIKDKHIILIDDVTTTGATIAEARKTLLSAGARKVVAYTVAH